MERRKSLKTYYGFILVKKGNGTICGRYPVTKKECTLGRGTECDIRIFLENISAVHCIILCINDKAYVRDKSIVGSTKVNGKKVGRNNYLLGHLDEIDICGRKFIWEYINPPFINSGIRNEVITPRVRERSSNQLNIPLVSKDNKILIPKVKTPSKTIISINKTPIVVASENMSKLSFDKLKNSLKKQDSTQSEHKTTSCTMVSGRNIPLINFGDSTPQRKPWAVTNASDNDSTPRGLDICNRFSAERSKLDTTPEFIASYHYVDENVEFDSPEYPHVISNYKHSDTIVDTSVEPSESANGQDDNFEICNSLSNVELESNSSRRNTFTIDNEPIVLEQCTTPAPKRSILKCSKTVKPHRARTSNRMVQFARLPKTDSKIKLKNQFNPKSSGFTVTDNDNNDADLSQNFRKVFQSDGEEYDDDLDGVQPLDTSVSSLMNSPILDHNNVNRSSIRGSRGNKVMSLVNSLEKRIKESPKHSIRASDLLSMNDSKGTSFNDSPNNTNVMLQVSASRRVNLEEIFEAEDSLKSTCNVNELNKTKSKDIDRSSVQSTEIAVCNSDLVDTEAVSIDVQNEDLSENECEYTFASPLHLNSIQKLNTIEVTGNNSNITEVIDDQQQSETITKTFNIPENIKKDNSISAIIKSSLKSNKIDSFDTNNDIQKDKSHDIIASINDNSELPLENEHLDVQNNVLIIDKKSTVEEQPGILNDDSEPVEKSTDIEKEKCVDKSTAEEQLDIQNDDSEPIDKSSVEQPNIQNDDSEPVEKSTDIEKEKCVDKSTVEEQLDIQNNDSEPIDKSIIEEQSDIQDDNSEPIEKSIDIEKEKCVDKSTVEEQLDIQNDDSEPIDKSSVEQSNIQNDDSEPVEKSTDIEKEKLDDSKNDMDEEEAPSMLVQIVSEMFDGIIDEHESTPCQHEDSVAKSYVLVDTVLHKSTERKKKKLTNSLTKEYKSVMKTVEKRLGEIHNGQTSSRINKNNIDSVKKGEKTISSYSDLNETGNLNLEINNISKKYMNKLSIKKSKNIINNSSSNNKTFPSENNTDIISISNTDNSDISEFPIETVENEAIDKSACYNDEFTVLLESLPVYDKTEKSFIENNSQRSVRNKTLNINQLDKSLKNKKNTSIKNNKNCLGKIVPYSDSDDIEGDGNPENINKNLEQTSDTSFGKPQYESTPWSSSKSAKAIIDTTNIQDNKTVHDEILVYSDEQRKESIFFEEWSQMMRDFNESVRKASISPVDYTTVRSVSKVLFVESSRSLTKVKSISNNMVDTTQCLLSPCSSINTVKTSNESNLRRRSARNCSNLLSKTNLKISPHSKISRKQYDSDHSDSNSSNKVILIKNNSMDMKITDKSNKKLMSDITTKLKPLVSLPLKKSSPTLKINNDVQDVTSLDEHNSDTDSSILNNLRMSTRSKKFTKKKNNSINTKTTLSRKQSDTTKKLNNISDKKIKKSLESSFENKSMLRSNKSYPKRNRNLTPEKKCVDDSTSDIESTTNSHSSLSLRTSTKTKKIKKKKDLSPEMTTRRSLRSRGLKNNSSKTVKKRNIVKINSNEEKSINIKKDSSKSEVQMSKRTLHKKENNLNIKESEPAEKNTSIKQEIKNVTKILSTENKNNKIKTENIEKNIQPIKARNTRQSTTTNPNLLLSDTNDKMANPIIGKKTKKLEKNSQTKKSKKTSRPKRVLPSKPIKQNNTDSSEYESVSETEDSQKLELLNNESHKVNELNKNNEIQVGSSSSMKSTRSRKRVADNSLSHPNTKGPKLDILSNVTSASISHLSSQNPSYIDVKCTRNMSKLIGTQIFDNSLSKSNVVTGTGTKTEKPKSSEKTRAKKRELSSKNISIKSESPSKKIARKATIKDKKNEVNKSKYNPSTTKTLNTDDDESKINTKVKFNINEVKKSISPKLKKTTRSTKKVITTEAKPPSPPVQRVLRNREKKN